MVATIFAIMDAMPTTKWEWIGWICALIFAGVFSYGAMDILGTIRRDDVWRSDFWGGIVFAVLALGLWWLSFYLWTGGTLLIIFIGVGLALACLAFFVFVEHYDDENRAKRLRFTLLASFCLILSIVSFISSYFQGIAWLAGIPGAVVGFVMSIRFIIWGGTILATMLLTLLFNWRLNHFTESLYYSRRHSGEQFDQSHVWRDERGFTFGPASRKDAYEYYHGRGSWYGGTDFLVGLIRFFAFVTPILLPLTIIWIAGWYSVWSSGGLLLTIILAAISITGIVRFRAH